MVAVLIHDVFIMCMHIRDMSYNYHGSLHMSQGGNGVLHHQIHKVDSTSSPKCWGSNSSVMFDISR